MKLTNTDQFVEYSFNNKHRHRFNIILLTKTTIQGGPIKADEAVESLVLRYITGC